MPSNAILEAKQQAVAELTELIKASAGGVIVNYQVSPSIRIPPCVRLCARQALSTWS